MKSLNNIPDNSIPKLQISDNPYTAEITRKKPTAIIFMIDQSGSMSDGEILYKGEVKSKAEIVTDMINSMLSELISRCTKEDGSRDYFDICLIGYGGESDTESNILWDGQLAGKTWVQVSELKESSKKVERTVIKNIRGNTKVTTEQVPYWITPVANNQTPMLHAIKSVFNLTKSWILNGHQNSFPPTLINITDGAYSDANQNEILQEANQLKELHTTDGHILFLNCHISDNSTQSTIFPSKLGDIPIKDDLAKDLYHMSSIMPKQYNKRISEEIKRERDISTNYVGMGFNANMDDLFRLIDIGTTQTK
jgi:hypothetical protein